MQARSQGPLSSLRKRERERERERDNDNKINR